MSNASFYKWRSKFDGMDASLISRMMALEEENRRLKKMYAEKSIHIINACDAPELSGYMNKHALSHEGQLSYPQNTSPALRIIRRTQAGRLLLRDNQFI